MKKLAISSIILTSIAFLSSCASDYPCGEPRSGRCSNMTQNYQNAQLKIVNPDDLPVNGKYAGCTSSGCSGSSSSGGYNLSPSSGFPQAYANGSPLISTPSMMRVWYSPYIDSDNIFHDQSYQYMITDRGHWLAGSNKIFGRSVSGYANTTVLVQSSNPAGTDATTANQPQPNQHNAAMNTAQQGASATNNMSSNPTALSVLQSTAAQQQPNKSVGLGPTQ